MLCRMKQLKYHVQPLPYPSLNLNQAQRAQPAGQGQRECLHELHQASLPPLLQLLLLPKTLLLSLMLLLLQPVALDLLTPVTETVAVC